MFPIDLPAPPDLAQLIDAYHAAELGDDWRARCSTYRDLIGWPGYRRGYTYHHGDIRVFRVLGSIKVGPWPRVAAVRRGG